MDKPTQPDTPTLDALLQTSAALHRHLCPRQVLGVRTGLLAGEHLGIPVPQPHKQMIAIVETDGCYTDGVAVATNCWLGRRTLRMEDYGKVAATFVDCKSERAVRIVPTARSRHLAANYAPEAKNRWEAMLLGYQRMPVVELLIVQEVTLITPIAEIISRAGARVSCARCGEEIINEREVVQNGEILCRACAGDSYYRRTTAL